MSAPPGPRAVPAFASAGAVLALCAIVVTLHEPGPHAWHMGLHIVTMSIVAPLLAASLASHARRSQASSLWAAALMQIVLLWGAHVPAVQDAAMGGLPRVALHVVLMAAALWFWIALLSLPPSRRWHALPALLLTGKLVCLLAALLVFAPRALYSAGHHGHTADDQHLAALLMLTACPLSYLVAAVIIAADLIQRTAPVRPAGGAG